MDENCSRLVLRLFGPQLDQVTQVLRAAADQGCPGLNLLMKNGEYAVCVTARGGDGKAVCRRWKDYFESRFGDAVFCEGEESLAQVAVHALAEARRLFDELYETRDENFGNGRTVRNIFEDAVARQADRIAAMDAPSREQLMELLPEDFHEEDET